MSSLVNRKVLITGASGGIGSAIAKRFASEAANLILTGRNLASLEAVAEKCRENGATNVRCCPVDLNDNTAVESFCHSLLEDGGIDVLVNNAGYFVQGNALNGEVENWQKAMQLNLLVPMLLTRKFAPGMRDREWGIIINLGSVAAIDPMSGVAAYAACKHGLRGWSRSCYEQLREFGIKVVLINPAFVDTKMTSEISVEDRTRMLQPEDVSEALMLAVNSSPACCPEEITLRLTRKVF